tara:strand:- start:374 stop:733 length:360 start_codon:yes stop_codon:yes gene_type:complete
MRTYYNTDTGSFLGAYNGPDESNPYRGHPSVEGIQQRDTRMTGGAVEDIPSPALTYREKRKAAYIKELGSEPAFENTVGDVLDDLIREVRALSKNTPETTEFKAVADKIDAIKARFPKP